MKNNKKQKQKNVQRHQPEEVSFFSLKAYIMSLFTAIFLSFIPPLMFDFNFSILFTKFGVWYIAYFLIMSGVLYAGLLYYIKVNYRKHLAKISDATRKVAKGDLSVEIELDESLVENSYINVMFRDFNLMVAELRSTEALKDDFISNVSHEIKTPLSVINNYTNALKNDDLPEKLKAEYREIIIESTEKLSDLVSNILKLNKIENGKISTEQKEFDLSRQLSDSLLSFEKVWEEKNIDISVEIEDRVIVKENFAFLDIIWHNLLSNAFKFTENGGAVSLKQTSDDEFITVKIKDSGCGIDEATKAHIFDKFYQGDTSHQEEGNGLGLALVQKIAERNNYEISVESEVDKGTEFTVKIKK